MHQPRAHEGQEAAGGAEIGQLEGRAAGELGTRGAAQVVAQDQIEVPGAVAHMQHLVRGAQGRTGGHMHGTVITVGMGAQLVEQLDAVHHGIVHQGGGDAHGLAGTGGQRGPGPGQAAGARGGHGQAHGHVGGGEVEGGALGFAVLTGAGQEFRLLHQGEETAAQARVAADAGNGGFPRLADAFFFRGLQEALGIVHAFDEIVAAHEHAQDIAVDVTDGLAQAAARTFGLAVGSGLETSFGAVAAFVRPLGRSEFVVLVHAGCSSRPPDGASLYEFVGDAVSRNGLTGKPPEGLSRRHVKESASSEARRKAQRKGGPPLREGTP